MKNSMLFLLAALSCQGAEVKLPPPFATPSTAARPRVIPKPADAELRAFLAQWVTRNGLTEKQALWHLRQARGVIEHA